MNPHENNLIIKLAKLLGGKLVDSNNINQALELFCDKFGFDGGLIYELDQYNYMHLKNFHLHGDIDKVDSFSIDIVSSEAYENLVKTDFSIINENENNTDDVKQTLNFFSAKSLLMDSIIDEQFQLYGLIVFCKKEPLADLTPEEKELLTLMLSLLGRYVSLRIYQNKIVFTKNSLGNILDNTGVDVYVNDFYTHDILYANKTMAAPYGGFEAFKGRKCWQALYDDKTGPCEFCPQNKLIDENGEPTKVYSWDYQRPFDGSWFRVFSGTFRWMDGRLAHVVTSVDITDNKNNEAMIEYLANYDSLTNLPNRRMLIKECERRIQAYKGQGGYVLFFDIDGFKAINDSLGHSAGDEFLVQLGKFFSELPLFKDSIYRNGGDEFVALIDGSNDEKSIRELGETIHARFKNPWHLSAGDVFCGVSIGVAHYPSNGATTEDLLHKADEAMYRVKKSGGKGILFDYELSQE